MNLWLLRHGQAIPYSTSDSQRELSEYGRQEVMELALRLQGQPFDLVLHSFYLRAKQTAEIVCDVIGYTGKCLEIQGITPEDDANKAINLLADYKANDILVVSHQPLLGRMVSLLTEGNSLNPFPYRTAGIVELKGEFICLAGMTLFQAIN